MSAHRKGVDAMKKKIKSGRKEAMTPTDRDCGAARKKKKKTGVTKLELD